MNCRFKYQTGYQSLSHLIKVLYVYTYMTKKCAKFIFQIELSFFVFFALDSCLLLQARRNIYKSSEEKLAKIFLKSLLLGS